MAQAVYSQRSQVRRNGGIIPDRMLAAINAAGLDPAQAIPEPGRPQVGYDEGFGRNADACATFIQRHGRDPRWRGTGEESRLGCWVNNVRSGRIKLDGDRTLLLARLGLAHLARQ